MDRIKKWLDYAELDQELKNELSSLSKEDLADAFYTDLSFGTGGIRGVIGPGTNRINIYTIRKANYGYGKYLLNKNFKNPSVVIAYDCRHKSLLFAQESAKVLASLGIKSYLFKEITPTPVLSYAVRSLNASGGIVITASHNPPKYNGYKIYDEFGCQLVPDLADLVISEIAKAPDAFAIEVQNFETLVNEKMVTYVDDNLYDSYLERVKQISVVDLPKTIKVVFTPLHGTASKLGKRLLTEVGYDVVCVDEQMVADPNFSTVSSPNPENPKAFEYAINYANSVKADICLATDPDADRVGLAVLDEGKYTLLTGNQTGAILLYYLIQNRKLDYQGVVFNTIVTSDLGAKIAKSRGLEVVSTLTGFKFIGEQAKLLEQTNKKFFFGYEESYGYVVEDFVLDKDSLQAMLLCCEACNFYAQQGKTLIQVLDEIYHKYGYYYDELVNVDLVGQKGLEKIETILNHFRDTEYHQFGIYRVIAKEDYLLSIRKDNDKESIINLPTSNVLKFFLDDGSWFVLRPSGTEPKMKIYFSVMSHNKKLAINKAQELKEIIFSIIEKVG